MKRFLILAASLFAAIACGNFYTQIATVSSPQMKIADDGAFAAEADGITVSYDFWALKGKVSFVLTNQTDEDVYVDLSRSFFIVNGNTCDYFQNRSYAVTAGGINFNALGENEVSSKASQKAASRTLMNVIANPYVSGSRNVTVNEKEGVWIPAHASRSFSEFTLGDISYRKCGLPRNPKKSEKASLDFSESDSPFVYENRLLLVSPAGAEKQLVNVFYVSNIFNILSSEVSIQEPNKDCNNKSTGLYTTVNKYQAKNRYYFTYYQSGSDNDRVKR